MIYFIDSGDALIPYRDNRRWGKDIPKHEVARVGIVPEGVPSAQGIRIFMETGAQKAVMDRAFPFALVDTDKMASENIGDYPTVTDAASMVDWLKTAVYGSPGGGGGGGGGGDGNGVIDFTANNATEQLDLETDDATFSVPVKRIAQTEAAFTAATSVVIPHSLGRLITAEVYEDIGGGNYRRFSAAMIDDGSTAIITWTGSRTGRVLWG